MIVPPNLTNKIGKNSPKGIFDDFITWLFWMVLGFAIILLSVALFIL